MWKCVMCETNNPVHCEECFICGTKKSDSLRISEDIKKREAYEKAMAEKAAAEKTPTDTPDASTSGIFGTASHKPVYEETKTPGIDPVPEYPSSVPASASEISEDVWADELTEKVENRKTKRDRRLARKEIKKDAKLARPKRTIGEKIFLVMLLVFIIFLFVGGFIGIFYSDDSGDSNAAYSPYSMTEFMP